MDKLDAILTLIIDKETYEKVKELAQKDGRSLFIVENLL